VVIGSACCGGENSEVFLADGGESVVEDEQEMEQLVWATLEQPSLRSDDPLHGLIRPAGSSSQFWGNGEESLPCLSSPNSFSTAAVGLCRCNIK
jgi:hypothetical protein